MSSSINAVIDGLFNKESSKWKLTWVISPIHLVRLAKLSVLVTSYTNTIPWKYVQILSNTIRYYIQCWQVNNKSDNTFFDHTHAHTHISSTSTFTCTWNYYVNRFDCYHGNSLLPLCRSFSWLYQTSLDQLCPKSVTYTASHSVQLSWSWSPLLCIYIWDVKVSLSRCCVLTSTSACNVYTRQSALTCKAFTGDQYGL